MFLEMRIKRAERKLIQLSLRRDSLRRLSTLDGYGLISGLYANKIEEEYQRARIRLKSLRGRISKESQKRYKTS